MKHWRRAGMAVLLTAALVMGAVAPAVAQDAAEEAGGFVTQAELARRLVERTGLWRYMGSARPSDAECFAALLAAGISPTADGWEADKEVTAAMLVRVLVQSLGRSRDVPADQRDDPEAWLGVLQSILEDMGLIETVEGALSVLTPDESIRTVIPWFAMTGDELRRRNVPGGDILEVFGMIEPAPLPAPSDVTPDAPVAG